MLSRRILRLLSMAGAVIIALGWVAAVSYQYVVGLYNPLGLDAVGVIQEGMELFRPMFSLNTEQSLPAWFSASLLFLCAIRLTGIAEGLARAKQPFARRWAVVAAAFYYVSFDEAVSIHERTMAPLREALGAGGLLYYPWVIPGAVIVLGLAVWTWPALRSLPAAGRNIILAAGLIYVGGAIGMEMIGGWWFDSPDRERVGWERTIYDLMTWTEESLEIGGTLVFLNALHGPWWDGAAGGTEPR